MTHVCRWSSKKVLLQPHCQRLFKCWQTIKVPADNSRVLQGKDHMRLISPHDPVGCQIVAPVFVWQLKVSPAFSTIPTDLYFVGSIIDRWSGGVGPSGSKRSHNLVPAAGHMYVQKFPASMCGGDIAGVVATSAQCRLSTGIGTLPYFWEAWSIIERELVSYTWSAWIHHKVDQVCTYWIKGGAGILGTGSGMLRKLIFCLPDLLRGMANNLCRQPPDISLRKLLFDLKRPSATCKQWIPY